jgi:hypothetical protein
VSTGVGVCAPGRFFLGLSIFSIYLLQRVALSILDCARRTSTFLSCAFREQEDEQATRSFLLSQVLKHTSHTPSGDSYRRRNVYVFAD